MSEEIKNTEAEDRIILNYSMWCASNTVLQILCLSCLSKQNTPWASNQSSWIPCLMFAKNTGEEVFAERNKWMKRKYTHLVSDK